MFKLLTLTFCASFMVFAVSPSASAGEDGILFNKGKQFAKTGQVDFAYMQFHEVVRNYPQSHFREDSLFAMGEYFFTESNFDETQRIFSQFMEEYPNSKLRIFALAYLYEIAQEREDEELTEKFKAQTVSAQQIALVFRNAKEYRYRSPMLTRFRALIEINKITIFRDGEILAEISY